MTDNTENLPQFAEDWVAEHELFGCIDAGLVRDFLSKFVLCEREPFGYFKSEPFGWTDCAETDQGAWPLYTPAAEVPK